MIKVNQDLFIYVMNEYTANNNDDPVMLKRMCYYSDKNNFSNSYFHKSFEVYRCWRKATNVESRLKA